MNDKPVPAFSYDFLTPFYDLALDIIGFGTKQREKTVSFLKLKPYERLLDLGCGTGTLLTVAKHKHPNINMTGIDVDSKVLEIAKDNIEGKIPEYLRQANFEFKEVSPRYLGIQYIMAKK